MKADDSFEAWYRRSYPTVLSSLALLCAGDYARAEEATCEAFLRALERWPRVSVMESPIGWTTTVALNLFKRRFRLQRDRWAHPNVESLADAVPLATGRLDLDDLLSGLTARQREVLVLRYVEDLSQQQIANRIGVAAGTVAATLHQARSKVRAELKEDDIHD